MILHAADGEGFHVIVASNAAEIGPEAELEIGVDGAAAFFGAEDAVVEGARVGVGHARAPQKENGEDKENVAPIKCVPKGRPTIAQRFNAGFADRIRSSKSRRDG